jgi:prepilin-type N-terminal cleavage/methylation domain-containing protein
MMPSHRRSGFTLIELSIVLVIIGLLVGGVLVGRDLIRAAQMRSFVGDMEELVSAINAFRTKYNCLPGDCANATQFFGKNTTLCNAHSGSAGTPGTCNGSGDKHIYSEDAYLWQHLSLAQLVPYIYPTTPSEIPKETLFKSGNTMFIVHWPSVFGPKPSVLIYLKGPMATLLSMEQKYDDGRSATGRIRVLLNGSTYEDDPEACVYLNGDYAPAGGFTDNNCLFLYALPY